MGKAQSIEYLEVSAPSRPGEWSLHSQLSYCTVLKNNDTNYLAEEYVILNNPRIPLLKNFEIYDYRRRQNHNLVEVYQVERQSSSYLCQGKDYLKVKTERIPFRLSELRPLTLPQGFFLLLNSLIGFKTIYEFNGPSIIDDEMISFNQEGKVKVWLNSNLAKNVSDFQVPFKNQDERVNEKGMVTQVLQVIKDHLETKQYPEDFIKFYQQISPNTFTETLQYIEDYIKYVKILLPTSVVKISEQQKTTSSLLTQKRGEKLLSRNPSEAKINSPILSCGLINTSLNNRYPPLASSQQVPTQIQNPQSSFKFSELTRQSVQVIQKRNSAEENVGHQMQASHLSITSNRNAQNTVFAFKQAKNKDDHLTQQYQPPQQFILTNPLPLPHHHIPLQTLPTQIQHRFQSLPKHTGLKNSKSVQNFHQFAQHKSHLSQIPKDVKSIPSAGGSYVQQRVTVDEKILPRHDYQRVNKLYHSPQSKTNHIFSLNNKSPSIINSLKPAPTGAKIQNIIRNSTNQNPVQMQFPNSTQYPLSYSQQHNFQNKQHSFIPNYQQVFPKTIIDHQKQQKLIYTSPHKNIQIDEDSNRRLQCTTKVDSVRPQIRRLMIAPKNIQTINTNSPYIEKLQEVRTEVLNNKTSSSGKSIISQIKQIQVKKYLIHPQVSPMKIFEQNKYMNQISTIKHSLALNHNQNHHNSITDNITVPEFKVQQNPFQSQPTDNNTPFKQSNQPILPYLRAPVKDDNQQISEQQMGQATLKIGQLRNIQLNDAKDQIDVSDIQTIVQRNSRSIQDYILSDIDELQFTLHKEPSVPSYEELRQALLTQVLPDREQFKGF